MKFNSLALPEMLMILLPRSLKRRRDKRLRAPRVSTAVVIITVTTTTVIIIIIIKMSCRGILQSQGDKHVRDVKTTIVYRVNPQPLIRPPELTFFLSFLFLFYQTPRSAAAHVAINVFRNT